MRRTRKGLVTVETYTILDGHLNDLETHRSIINSAMNVGRLDIAETSAAHYQVHLNGVLRELGLGCWNLETRIEGFGTFEGRTFPRRIHATYETVIDVRSEKCRFPTFYRRSNGLVVGEEGYICGWFIPWDELDRINREFPGENHFGG
jgi:hypothetical protein